MNNLTSEQKANYGRILGLIGSVLSLFLPFIGLLPLAFGIYCTHKQETIEEKHAFVFNLVAIIASLIILIFTLISSFA